MLSEKAKQIIEKLNNRGYSAYAVGGCVRDLLCGVEPSDYDIATSATPEETEKVFCEYRIIKTGIKHGTVTVIYKGEKFEITTFRAD